MAEAASPAVRRVDPGAAVPKSKAYWGGASHRRAVVVGVVVFAVIAGGGVTAWEAVSGGSTGYQTASVTRADIETTMGLVGNVEPVSDAAPSFQVGGKVDSVTVATGQEVTAGQTLATLDTTSLSETVSSDQSTVNADEAKLVEDENSQSSSATSGSTASSGAPKSSSQPTTSTTVPSSGTSTSGQNPTITADQTTLTQDEATLDTDQQKEVADLAQAQTDCTSANTSTQAGQATCEAGLQTVSADEQQVSKDQSTVSKDETALAEVLATSSGTSSSGTGSSGASPSGGTPPGGNAGSSSTQSNQALSSSTGEATLTAAVTGNTGSVGAGSAPGGTGGSGSTNTDTPEQIASDQASIDTAEAQLTEARQSLNEATLTSPITGTVVSVGISMGDTVSADSSTEVVTIVGTSSYEVQATLDSSQVPSVKVGQSAAVEVDGVDGKLAATVAQVGPVQSSTSGYSYPVVVALPATSRSLHPGSAADVTIATGQVAHVVAVPTSAVQTAGSTSYVLEFEKGALTRKVIKVGMVGYEYAQVLSGLSLGQSVVLADYAEAVPSSNTNTNTTGGLGGLLGGSGSGGFSGGGFPGGGSGGFTPRISGEVGGGTIGG